jgi:hypothetical protein
MIYLAGQHNSAGSVMRFRRRNGELEWYIKLIEVYDLTAFVQDKNTDYFYGCGHDSEGGDPLAPTGTDVHMFKIDEDADIKMY